MLIVKLHHHARKLRLSQVTSVPLAWEYLSHGKLLQAIGNKAHLFEHFRRLIYYMRVT
jgi:hypothetical protein